MFTVDRRPPPAALPSPAPKPAPQGRAKGPPVNALPRQAALSSLTETAEQPAQPAQAKVALTAGYGDLVAEAACQGRERREMTAAPAATPAATLQRPSLERPAGYVSRRRASESTHPAERQADDLGGKIADELRSSTAVGAGPLPGDIRAAAEKHLGVGLPDVRLQAGQEGHAKARGEGALAVTEGSTISFGAGQLSTATHRGRALLGHELTHVAQQAATGSPTTQRQTPEGEEVDASEGMTIAPPPGHEERKAGVAAVKDELAQERTTRDDLRARLDAVPQETSEETVAERTTLRDEIRKVEEHIIERLTAEIGLIDEAVGALLAVMPNASAPGAPEVPDTLWADLRSLEGDKKAAEAERKALRRSRARDEIRAIQEQLAQLDAKDPARKELEERQKKVGEVLSGTAEKRAAPGTVGKSKGGRRYVVYAHAVKVGGSLPWINNNPGNVQRSPNGVDFPGVIGVDEFKHFIFSSVEDGKSAVFLDLQERRGGPNATLASALRSYVVGSKKDADLPEDLAECDRLGIPRATCVTKKSAREYAPNVTGTANLPMDKALRALTREERSALVEAILYWEGGTFGKRGDEYTCGDLAAPQEYRDLLGCDE
jgi:hypothetical protein